MKPGDKIRPFPKAPPIYRPQPVPKVLQKKPAIAAPPAYRPTGVPKVLQTKSAVQQRPPAQPARSIQLARSQTPPTRTPTPAFRQPGSNVIQRLAVRAWQNFDLNTFTYKGRRFHEVKQSENRRFDVYIGKGIAYTTGMRTCATLAMYDPETTYSYLMHVDATCKSDAIAETLRTYAGYVGDPRRVYARIYTQPDESNSSTVQSIKAAFRARGVPFAAPAVVTGKRDRSYEVDAHSVVIVGHGMPYIYTSEINRLDYALKRYVMHKKSQEQVDYARDAIIAIIRGGTARSQVHDIFKEETFLNAAVKAYQEGDRELLGVLSKWRGVRYEDRARGHLADQARERLRPPTPTTTTTATPTTTTTTTTNTTTTTTTTAPPGGGSRPWADYLDEEMDYTKPPW